MMDFLVYLHNNLVDVQTFFFYSILVRMNLYFASNFVFVFFNHKDNFLSDKYLDAG